MKKLIPFALFALIACTASPVLANGPTEKAIVLNNEKINALSDEQLQQVKQPAQDDPGSTPANHKHNLKKMIDGHLAKREHVNGGYFYISGAGLILLVILLIILL